MNIEDRLRQAIDARTASVEPSLDRGLDRIDHKLGSSGDPMHTPPKNWMLAAAAAAVVLLAATVATIVLRDDGGEGDDIRTVDEPPGTTDTSGPDRSTTSTPTSSTTTSPPDEAPSGPPADVQDQALWPRPSSDVRFDDPEAAARSFARYLAQFADPVVGEYRAGDSRSGEVPVRPTATGPETTVLVRQLSDDSWYVIGSVTSEITVDQPAAGATLADPQALAGSALAFEGTVQVRLVGYRSDGRSEDLGSTFVTGSGSPPPGPFSGQLGWSPGPAELEPVGVLLFTTSDESGELGGTWQVVAVPVRIRA